METILQWRQDLPEMSGMKIQESFTCDFIPVLVTGRFEPDGSLLVHLVNRMRRKKTGYTELDESNALQVPLDDHWHWQSTMTEILAWSPLPEEDDPRWIPCESAMPEDREKIHSFGHTEIVSVLGLCETFDGAFCTKLINRVNVERVGNSYLDEVATDGWEWSSNAKNVKAWMPFPKEFAKNEVN